MTTDNDVVTSASDTPAVVLSKPAPQSDAVKPPVGGPVLGLLKSRKAIVMLVMVIGCLILVGIGRVSWEQAREFLSVVVVGWLGSHALEEGLSKHRRTP